MSATEQKTATATFVVDVEEEGEKKYERPFLREYVEAENEADAVAKLQERFDADTSEGPEDRRLVATVAVPLQPILEKIIEEVKQGVSYSLAFKHEDGNFGPVWVTNNDAERVEAEKQGAIREDGSIVMAVPFGSDPDYVTALPWMRKSDAKRLAKYLDVPYGES